MTSRKKWIVGALVASVVAAGWIYSSAVEVADLREQTPGETCSVHELPFEVDTVPLCYGLFMIPSEYHELVQLSQSDFPNANFGAYGGCVVGDARRAQVKYCARCRTLEREWYAQHEELTPLAF